VTCSLYSQDGQRLLNPLPSRVPVSKQFWCVCAYGVVRLDGLLAGLQAVLTAVQKQNEQFVCQHVIHSSLRFDSRFIHPLTPNGDIVAGCTASGWCSLSLPICKRQLLREALRKLYVCLYVQKLSIFMNVSCMYACMLKNWAYLCT
jgi:hypothetical protein